VFSAVVERGKLGEAKCGQHKLWSYFTALFCEITVLHCAKLLILYTQLYLMPLCTETSQNIISMHNLYVAVLYRHGAIFTATDVNGCIIISILL